MYQRCTGEGAFSSRLFFTPERVRGNSSRTTSQEGGTVTTVEKGTRGFTREGVLALSELKNEPEWMRKRRLEAWEVYERTPMPDIRRDEEWRRTDLSGLHL